MPTDQDIFDAIDGGHNTCRTLGARFDVDGSIAAKIVRDLSKRHPGAITTKWRIVKGQAHCQELVYEVKA